MKKIEMYMLLCMTKPKKLWENAKNSFNLNINNIVRSNPCTNINELVKYIELLNEGVK
ncbi:hypothetical protein [Clostridium cavendishii]|uniref:hypothetical protein n=1 Tax=Clostridium cavendishii TaxID=349931 RepID=UPI001356559A|nr:hypothetical protein [Clostridium cavendishii]